MKRIAQNLISVMMAAVLSALLLTACGAETASTAAEAASDENGSVAAVATEQTEPKKAARPDETIIETMAETTVETAETTTETTAETTQATTVAEPEEPGLPLIIYTATYSPFITDNFNYNLDNVIKKGTNDIVFLTADSELYIEVDYIMTDDVYLVDTDVRDVILDYDNVVYYVKNDNTLWAFGNNEDKELGKPTVEKGPDGYDTEVYYVDYTKPVQLKENVANIYYNVASNDFRNGKELIYLGTNGKLRFLSGTILAEDIADLAMYSHRCFNGAHDNYYVLTTNGDFFINNLPGSYHEPSKTDVVDIVSVSPDVIVKTKDGNYWNRERDGKFRLFLYPADIKENVKTIINADHVITNDDVLWAKGENNNGELGDGSKIDKTNFVKIADDVYWADPDGYSYIKNDGTIYSWSESNATHTETTLKEFNSSDPETQKIYYKFYVNKDWDNAPEHDSPAAYENPMMPSETEYTGE